MTTLAENGSYYTDDRRREALGAFVVLGNIQKVAAHVGIPARTIYDWSKKEWWLKELATVREEKSQELDMQLSISIEKARESVDSRLDVGDPYINKDGQIDFKPVSCRDSATVLGILYDKRALMRNMPTKIVANQDLSKLQATFEELVTKRAAFNTTIVSD
jgi:hypothetical protein